MSKRNDMEEIQKQARHEFPQDDPHVPPPGCSGISAYIPRPWLRAYKTVLKSRDKSIFEDLNRHVIETVLSDPAIQVWDVQRVTAQGEQDELS